MVALLCGKKIVEKVVVYCQPRKVKYIFKSRRLYFDEHEEGLGL